MSDIVLMENAKDTTNWQEFADRADRKKGKIISARIPGGNAAKKGEEVAQKYLKPISRLISAAIVIILAGLIVKDVFIIFLGILLLLIARLKFRESITKSISWLKGSNGEKIVAEHLRPLESKHFRILHDLMEKGKGNIDHVVIGGTGIFVIETKANKGRVSYYKGKLKIGKYSFRRDPLKQVRGEAVRVAEKLEQITGKKEYANPILCFTKAWVENNALTVGNIRITRPQFLREIITKGKARFKPEEIDEMAKGLNRLFE